MIDYGELRIGGLEITKGGDGFKKPYLFQKGHIPHNKGKKWDEIYTKEAQARCAKGWANLAKYRHKPKAENAGRKAKAVIRLNDDGSFNHYATIRFAGEATGSCWENIKRCCNLNAQKGKNTNHRVYGYRFYYEDDPQWLKKLTE